MAPPRRRTSSHPAEPLSPADRLLAVQTLALVLFSAWACGGRVPWAPPVMLALAVAGLATVPLRRHERQPVRWAVFIPLILWLALLALALLNPSHALDAENIRRFPRPGWIAWLPTTIDRVTTLRAQLPWTAALLQGALWTAAPVDRRIVRFVWGAIAVNGLALAVVGAAFRFDGATQMLGFINVPEPTYFFATFFYKSHWAAYGALCASAGAALALGNWQQGLRGDPRGRARAAFFGTTLFFTAVTLPMPGSRAGALLAFLLLLGTGGSALLLVVVARRLSPARRWLAGAALVLGLTVGANYGVQVYGWKIREDWARTQKQFNAARRGDSPELRLQLARSTLKMAQDRPWFGWGLGAYETVFPLYSWRELRDDHGHPLRVQFAHNDWLQLAAETGWGTLALLAGLAGCCGWRGWSRSALSGRAVLVGCGVIAAYAWVDFPLYNPAVLLLWTILLSSACARRSHADFAAPGRTRDTPGQVSWAGGA